MEGIPISLKEGLPKESQVMLTYNMEIYVIMCVLIIYSNIVII
jgi:hypothetical protein